MAKKQETFLLVSLKESESKKLAQIISNNTSRKILNFLSAKTATESELAKQLSIPISTIHYNLNHLVKAKLIDSKEYHYSEKGKEVNHYSIAKKYIIIAPSTQGIRTKLKNILPMIGVTIAGAAIIHLVSNVFTAGFAGLQKSADARLFAESAEIIAETAPISSHALPGSVWFLIGGACIILVYLLGSLIKNNKS